SSIPFRPGAKYAGSNFGLRTVDHIMTRTGRQELSLIHLGVDRGQEPRAIYMPFDGTATYYLLGEQTAFGSLLRIRPDAGIELEIHVAHTVYDTAPFFHVLRRGQR